MSDFTLTPAEAEYVILRAYDQTRLWAGHDYGSGQRARELARRARAIEDPVRLREVYRLAVSDDWNEHRVELLAAFDKVAWPKIRRLFQESYRTHTPATKRTISAWRRVEERLELDFA